MPHAPTIYLLTSSLCKVKYLCGTLDCMKIEYLTYQPSFAKEKLLNIVHKKMKKKREKKREKKNYKKKREKSKAIRTQKRVFTDVRL